MKWIKKNMTTILLLLILLVGLSLLLYPTVSDYWNSLHQSRAIATYAQAVAEVDDKQYEHMWDDAYEYNQQLKSKSNRWIMTDEEREEYESLLDVSDNGILGYIEIPKIKVFASNLSWYRRRYPSDLQLVISKAHRFQLEDREHMPYYQDTEVCPLLSFLPIWMSW